MMCKVRWNALAGLVGVGVLAQSAHAARYQYEAEAGNYTASPGHSVSVKVYLRETPEAAGAISLDEGLYGVCFQAALQDGDAVIASIAGNGNFANIVETSPATGVFVADQLVGTSTPGMPDANGRVWLATLDIQAGMTDSLFLLQDNNRLSDQCITWAGTVLDSAIAGGSFSLVVPEPTSGLLSLAGFFLLSRSAYKRHP